MNRNGNLVQDGVTKVGWKVLQDGCTFSGLIAYKRDKLILVSCGTVLGWILLGWGKYARMDRLWQDRKMFEVAQTIPGCGTRI